MKNLCDYPILRCQLFSRKFIQYLGGVIRNITILTALLFFTFAHSFVEARDCSDFKQLHKKLMCKAGSDKYDPERSETAVKPDKVKKNKGESFNEKYNSLSDIFDALKKKN